ncbi:MAG TPA: ABC transporter ATP-binding protein [Microbacteriaceae bacterium]|nr:ABC transporter ATP-binding protein [Microbacteriaceae bacterium]
MTSTIVTRTLVKRYGQKRALDGLDLEVQAGSVHGFLGPNGAGKSTTIRILLGLARASSGEAAVFGLDPWADAGRIHKRTAYVPGDVSIWPNLTGGESIDLLTRMRGGHGASVAAEKARLMEAFEFEPRTRGRAYSKGNRQKVALIAALAVPADLYVFDEPTSGLDPLMEVTFRHEVARLRDRGATVLLSSHILSEVEHLCDAVSIIRAGRIVDSGSLAELRHLTRTQFSVDGTDVASVATLPGVSDVEVRDGRVHFTVATDSVNAALAPLGALGVRGLSVQPASLEDVFLRHYGEVQP